MSRRLTWSFLAAVLLAVVFLHYPSLLYALQDSVVVHDKTGIVGAVIDKWWLLVGTFLASTSLKIASYFNKRVATWPEPAQWTALYGIALLWNLFAKFAGIAEVDALAPVFLSSFAQMGVAGLIYKWGGHRVPVAKEPATAPLR